MKVLMVSKGCVVGAYQRKLEEMAARGMELTVVVPAKWRDPSGVRALEKRYTQGYRLVVSPMRFNGHFHLHYYPELRRILADVQPHIVHVDEEPWDFVTYHAVKHALRASARPLFFTWQNLLRRYPWPFSYFQAFAFRQCSHVLAGTAAAGEVLRRKGYRGQVQVAPQFGVDPEIFRPADAASAERQRRLFSVGYAGRFTPEKGIDTLLGALKGMGGEWQLRLAGSGPELPRLRRLAHELEIAECVHFETQIASTQMPDFYRALDVLVLPSRRARNWVEQFGRVLIEAMACGVPVIGSDSGEIPNTIGAAGLIFAVGDERGLREHLQKLMHDAALRCELGQRGRARVLEQFTQAQVAEQTVSVYRQMLAET